MENTNTVINSDNNQPINAQPLPPINTAPIISSPISEPAVPTPNKNKSIIFYIVCGILILLLISGCFMLAFKSEEILNLIIPKNKKINNTIVNNKNVEDTVVSINTTQTPAKIISNVAPTNSEKKNLGPKESYLLMKAEGDKLNTFDGYVAFTNKYGSKNKITEINKSLSQMNSLPPGFKEQVVSMAKAGSPQLKDITDIQENVNNNIATLDISTNKPNLNGTITLVLEEGIWKMDNESWKEEIN